jgi:hypothetical protein
MASFDPQLPLMPVPDWSNNSRPVSQPESDKSLGQTLSTIGEGIQGAASLAENTAEDYLKEKVHAGVDALRDSTTLAYQNIRNAQVTGATPDPNAVRTAGFTGSLSSPGTTDVPEALQAGLDKASTLALAKSQGRANDTLYTGALNAMAKQLRAQYPGHRDFIDEQIARISGVNPANAYMQNLLVDINRAESAGGKENLYQKMVQKTVSDNIGDPAVQKWLLAAQHGLPNADQGLVQSAFRAEQQKWQHQQWQSNREETQGNLADDASLAKNQYEIRSQQIIQSHLNPVLDIPGLTTPQRMGQLVQDSQEGKIALTSEQHTQLLSSLVAARNQAADHLQSVANGEGYAGRIKDPAATQAIMNRQLEYFDRMIDAVKNKDYGTMFEAKRRADAMQDQTRLQANTSNLGEWLRQRKVFQDYLGPQWNNYLDSLGLRENKLQDLQSFVNDSHYRASAPDDVRKDGTVASLYNDLETAKKAKATGTKAPDAVYDNLTDNVNLILKANETGKTDVAKNVVDYTFDPTKNAKIMDFFGRDFTDNQGKFHKGKFAVYDTLTQPKITDAISRIGDRQSWTKYKDWQEMSFKNLFGEEVKNLNSIAGDKSQPFKLLWDSDNNRMSIEWGSKPQTSIDQNYQQWANRSINALNSGLKNLSYMHSKEGSDTSEYVFDMLGQLGYSPNDKLEGNNLPAKVMQAIKASQQTPKSPEERIKETFEKARGG